MKSWMSTGSCHQSTGSRHRGWLSSALIPTWWELLQAGAAACTLLAALASGPSPRGDAGCRCPWGGVPCLAGEQPGLGKVIFHSRDSWLRLTFI